MDPNKGQSQYTSKLKYGSSFKSAIKQEIPIEEYGNNGINPTNYHKLKSNQDNKFDGDLDLPPASLVTVKSDSGVKETGKIFPSTQNVSNSKLFSLDILGKEKFNETNKSNINAKQESDIKYTCKISPQNPTQSNQNASKLVSDAKQIVLGSRSSWNLKQKSNIQAASKLHEENFKRQKPQPSKIYTQQILQKEQQLDIQKPSKSDPTSNFTQKQNAKFQICCIMKENCDIFHLAFFPSKVNILQAVAAKINQIYQTKLTSYQNIQFCSVQRQFNEYKKCSELIYQFSKKINNIEQWVQDQKEILLYVGIIIKDSKFKCKRANQIYKSPQNLAKSNQKLINIESYDRDGIILKYDAIRHYPVKYILDILDYKKSQGRCLKMQQKYFLKDDFLTFNFENEKVNHLTAKVIGQQYQFEKIMKQTSQLSEQQLYKLIGKQANKKLSPLMIYTSNYQFQQNPKEPKSTFERIINRYLKQYFKCPNKSEDDWKNKLVKSMMKQMAKLQNYSGETYWICPIDFNNYQADKDKKSITFPEFLRTTINAPKAGELKEGSTLFKIISKTGKKISISARYQSEKIIFKPFTNFRIIKSEASIFELQQTLIEQQTIQVNFILWVDTGIKQSQEIFKLLDCPISTYKYFFQSTESLEKWLNNHLDYIGRPQIKIIVVTNMRRVENKLDTKDAGAKTAFMVRKIIPTAPIIVYIQDKDNAFNWLKTYKIDVSKVQLIDSAEKCIQSLINHCCRNPIIKKASSPSLPSQKISEKIKKQNWRELFDFKLPE